MEYLRKSMMSILGLLICAIIGMSVSSCARKTEVSLEKQADIDTARATYANEPDEWVDAQSFVKAYKAYAEIDSVDHVIYSLPEETLCAVVNVVKRTHAKFTAKDVVTEYFAHKDIYDETQKVKEEPRAESTGDTLSYDTILNGTKVHVTEYEKIK